MSRMVEAPYSGENLAKAPEPVLGHDAFVAGPRPGSVTVAVALDFAFGLLCMTAMVLIILAGLGSRSSDLWWYLVECIVPRLIGAAHLWLAFELGRRNRRAWQLQVVVSLPALLFVPVGTAVYGLLLFAWFSPGVKNWFDIW